MLMIPWNYSPLIAALVLLAVGVSLGLRSRVMSSNCDRVDSKVIDVEMTSMAKRGKPVVKPTFQYQDAANNEIVVWTPTHSSTWYDFKIGQAVTLLVERNGDWRSVYDFRSLYLVPICLTAFGAIGSLFGWLFVCIRRLEPEVPNPVSTQTNGG
jgi:hypothetical protein